MELVEAPVAPIVPLARPVLELYIHSRIGLASGISRAVHVRHSLKDTPFHPMLQVPLVGRVPSGKSVGNLGVASPASGATHDLAWRVGQPYGEEAVVEAAGAREPVDADGEVHRPIDIHKAEDVRVDWEVAGGKEIIQGVWAPTKRE